MTKTAGIQLCYSLKKRLFVEKAGDMTINDSSEVHFIKCDTIMPWLGVTDGDIVNVQFPDYQNVPHYVFDKNTPGINGVDIKVTFDSCSTVLWGFDSWPGSYINVYNSNWTGVAFRIYEDAIINNVYDYTIYPSFNMPLTDRTFTLSNTYFHFWFPYVYDNAVVYIDSCRYAEGIAHNNAEIYITNTSGQIVEAQNFVSIQDKTVDLSSQPKGIYFVKIIENDKIKKTEKIIIQ